MMSFCTAINCMDGRTQEPVISFLKQRFGTDHVDSITEPGPIRFLANEKEGPTAASIMQRLEISVKKHGSKAIAVVAHAECTGNPYPKDFQLEQLGRAIDCVKHAYPDLEVIGLWLGLDWTVTEFRIS